MLETKLRTKGINHTVLHVKDVAKSRQFYLDVLGITVNHEDATHAFLWWAAGKWSPCSRLTRAPTSNQAMT